jgi:hypothetical protein
MPSIVGRRDSSPCRTMGLRAIGARFPLTRNPGIAPLAAVFAAHHTLRARVAQPLTEHVSARAHETLAR